VAIKWRRAALLLIGLAGMAVLGLSFVDGWIVHVRHIGGHGLTVLETVVNAWERRSVPVLSAGVLLAAIVAALALWRLTRADRSARTTGLLLIGCVAALGLLLASAVPLEHEGVVVRVELSAGWPLLVSIGLVSAMTALAALLLAPRPSVLAAAAVLAALLVVAGTGGRALGLALAEGDNRHYADGSYLRMATNGQPTETLLFQQGRYEVGDRWSGRYEGRGLVISLVDDPACPDARGTYRVWGEGEQDIWWQTIVDVCADGERAADLTTGIWVRQ
jgi:hypothetical protein